MIQPRLQLKLNLTGSYSHTKWKHVLYTCQFMCVILPHDHLYTCRTNFFRVCRIVVDHVPGVLREVFKREVKARYGHVWDDTPNSGDWLMKTPGGVERWRRNLNKDQKRDISSGDCNKWDPTLLFHTLLYSSLCLLADEIPKATLNQDTLTLAAPDPKVAVGCKVIIDMGNEHFSREITKQLPPTMPPTTFRLTSKVPKSPNAVYLCGEKYDAVNKLRLHRNKRYAHVKAAAISTEDLNQLIEEVEDIWIELYDTRDDFRRWKNALKAIKSGENNLRWHITNLPINKEHGPFVVVDRAEVWEQDYTNIH